MHGTMPCVFLLIREKDYEAAQMDRKEDGGQKDTQGRRDEEDDDNSQVSRLNLKNRLYRTDGAHVCWCLSNMNITMNINSFKITR